MALERTLHVISVLYNPSYAISSEIGKKKYE